MRPRCRPAADGANLTFAFFDMIMSRSLDDEVIAFGDGTPKSGRCRSFIDGRLVARPMPNGQPPLHESDAVVKADPSRADAHHVAVVDTTLVSCLTQMSFLARCTNRAGVLRPLDHFINVVRCSSVRETRLATRMHESSMSRGSNATAKKQLLYFCDTTLDAKMKSVEDARAEAIEQLIRSGGLSDHQGDAAAPAR